MFIKSNKSTPCHKATQIQKSSIDQCSSSLAAVSRVNRKRVDMRQSSSDCWGGNISLLAHFAMLKYFQSYYGIWWESFQFWSSSWSWRCQDQDPARLHDSIRQGNYLHTSSDMVIIIIHNGWSSLGADWEDKKGQVLDNVLNQFPCSQHVILHFAGAHQAMWRKNIWLQMLDQE